MASLNRCEFIGNLGKDPEVRTMQNGDKVANLSLACSESWKDKSSGERKERTEWVRVVLFGGTAEVAEKYLSKGSKCYVAGSLATRKWQNKDGADQYSTEIVVNKFGGQLILLDKPKSEGRQDDRGDAPRHGGFDSDANNDAPF